MLVALIQRFPIGQAGRQQGIRYGLDVGQDPDLAGGIEGARLAWNVGRREPQPQKARREVWPSRFRDHFARPIRQEAIEHDPIKATEPGNFTHRVGEEGFQRLRTAQTRKSRRDPLHESGIARKRVRVIGQRLPFQDGDAADPVSDAFE
jgi:hypothetical protein